MSGVRLDLVLLECVGVVARNVHPNAGLVWDGGGREVMAEKLKEIGVSSEPLTLVDVARKVGVLGPDPNVIVVNPAKTKRRVPRGV